MKQIVRACLLGALLFNSAWLSAQSAEPNASAPAAQTEPEPAAQTAPPANSEAGAAAAGKDSSPYDYQASEQISEDLSVSFPVDI